MGIRGACIHSPTSKSNFGLLINREEYTVMRERKRACSIRADVNLELNTVRFWAHDYGTEKPVPGMDFRFDAGRLNAALHKQAILKGCEDSIRDAGALGADATIGQKFAAMRERADWLM